MGVLQKIHIKKDFYKIISDSPKRRIYGPESINLPLFDEYVDKFIKDIEDKINTCLNAFFYDLNINIKMNKKKSNRSKLAFYNVDNPNEEYLIENGKIEAIGSVTNNSVIDYGISKKSRVEKTFRYYETIVSSFAQMSVALFPNVEYRYGFFEDRYFFLDTKLAVGGARIYRVKKETIDDDTNICYFNLDDIQPILEKIIIPDKYSSALNVLKQFVGEREQTVRDEIRLELKKQETKQALEEKLEQKYLEILEVEKELSELYGEIKRITIADNHLFEKVDDVKYFKRKWLPFLQFIDLSKVNLSNVDIVGIDFSYTNLKLNPQVVHNKDLRNCRFVSSSPSEWIFDKNTDFSGCLMDGTYIDDAPVSIGVNHKSYNLKIINNNEYHE